MKNIIYILFLSFITLKSKSQPNILPAKPQIENIYIINGTVHQGNGTVLENATIEIIKGKITQIGKDVIVPTSGAIIVDASNQHVYPGLILPNTDLGLKEISSGVRGSNDYQEIGENNANVRSIVAYNTDSRNINVLRANGILLANIVPEGEQITGLSSVVQLDAWNWEDAAYKIDNGLHINLPNYLPQALTRSFFAANPNQQNMKELIAKNDEAINTIKTFFREAKSYFQELNHTRINLKFEAIKGLFTKQQTLFFHADDVKQMLKSIDFITEFGFKVVIVGGLESYQIAPILAKYKIAVILNSCHHLPAVEDDDIDQTFKTPAILQKANVLFAINDDHDQSKYRNLSFNAGTSASYGLTKEEALSSITLNVAKILGIDDKTGSIEVGKDANIIISKGDILDIKTNEITDAFIQGRRLNLDNIQKQLYLKFKSKYK